MNDDLRRLRCVSAGGRETSVLVGRGISDALADHVSRLGPKRQVFALVDQAVLAVYPDLLPSRWLSLSLPAGEACKTFASLEHTLRAMAQAELDRTAVLVTAGGGTIGDLGALAASLYLRGVDLVQVPTTLLAMLDSSIGGKTALNLPEGKNLVGSFWPPAVMLADVDLLQSLPADQLRSGLAEALKMGLGFSPELFDLMERHQEQILAGDPELLVEVVTLAIAGKIQTVEADPLEQNGLRRCLNLGHTLGHALEAQSGYSLLHGHAVARGLHYAVDLAERRQLLSATDADRSRGLLAGYGFDPSPLPAREDLRPFLARDKKMVAGQLHMVLPTGIGSCQTTPLTLDELLSETGPTPPLS